MIEINALSVVEIALKGRLEKFCCGEATWSTASSYQESTDSLFGGFRRVGNFHEVRAQQGLMPVLADAERDGGPRGS